jgi:hypothetical protein
VAGAEALLALRAVHENGDWEAFHEFRRAQQHQTLYAEPLDETWLDLAERFEIKQFLPHPIEFDAHYHTKSTLKPTLNINRRMNCGGSSNS